MQIDLVPRVIAVYQPHCGYEKARPYTCLDLAYKTSSKCTCESCSIPAKGYYRIATYRRVIVLVFNIVTPSVRSKA